MAKGKYQDWLTDDGLLLIEGWARDGLTDEQIALNKIGVAYSTFRDWLAKYPALSAALKNGKAPVDTKVENALLNSATGYFVTVKKPKVLKTRRQLANKGMIEEEHIEYVEEEVYIPPNTTAQIFWLKNRKPDKWRERRDEKENTAERQEPALLARAALMAQVAAAMEKHNGDQ